MLKTWRLRTFRYEYHRLVWFSKSHYTRSLYVRRDEALGASR